MPATLFFAHANGFPSGTYAPLLAKLATAFCVQYLPQHGHDPCFPVEDNWALLVDELLQAIRAQPTPVWGWAIPYAGCCTYTLHYATLSCTRGSCCWIRRC